MSEFEKKVFVAKRCTDGLFAASWNDGRHHGWEWVPNPIDATWRVLNELGPLEPPKPPAYYFSPYNKQDDPQWIGVEMVRVTISANLPEGE